MSKPTLRDRFIAVLERRGNNIDGRSSKFIQITRKRGGSYFIGSSGAAWVGLDATRQGFRSPSVYEQLRAATLLRALNNAANAREELPNTANGAVKPCVGGKKRLDATIRLSSSMPLLYGENCA